MLFIGVQVRPARGAGMEKTPKRAFSMAQWVEEHAVETVDLSQSHTVE